jgi:hypothetical protein
MIKKPPLILLVAFLFSLVLHLTLFGLWLRYKFPTPPKIDDVLLVQLQREERPMPIERDQPQVATQEAPPAPTAEEWAFASQYTLKNSKGYRHAWGKQVRSMMGTAVEGPDQGQVRFRIAIAPNGSVTSVETLWKTSDQAEALARKAIYSMPPPPPTPTGKPLIFEKTISFTPFANDDTPFYGDDCLPDPPSFSNPFAWDGKSPQEIKPSKPAEKLSPEALAECLKRLPRDSIDGVMSEMNRHLNIWSSSNLNPK